MNGLLALGVAACPYCSTYAEGKGSVYYLATILMLGLPIVLLAGLTLWLTRAARRNRGLEAASDAPLRPMRSP